MVVTIELATLRAEDGNGNGVVPIVSNGEVQTAIHPARQTAWPCEDCGRVLRSAGGLARHRHVHAEELDSQDAEVDSEEDAELTVER